MVTDSGTEIVLTVCIPTYKRPALLERALRSVIDSARSVADRVEILVSDNSPDATEEVAARLLDAWPGRAQYVGNRPDIGMTANLNQCINYASGRYVLIVHDDDFLLPNGVVSIIDAIEKATNDPAVLVFGVHVVNVAGQVRRRQEFSSPKRLGPGPAMKRLLTNSSFIRFPAVVVRRDAYTQVGGFAAGLQGADDFEMWIRLFSVFGVSCVPATTSAYTIHADAATSSMFNPGMMAILMGLFDQAARTGVLSPRMVRRCQVHWVHQFILGGSYRQLRAGDIERARAVMDLFRLPSVRSLGPSVRWVPARAAFSLLLWLPPVIGRSLVRMVQAIDGEAVGSARVVTDVPAKEELALSVCIPAFNRPSLLKRALRSVLEASADPDAVEIVISDDSTDDRSELVTRQILASWSGLSQYVRNVPRLQLVNNFNQCIRLARGRFILILHDDDFLLPGAISAILATLDRRVEPERVFLFGVEIVDGHGAVLRRQVFHRDRYLSPEAALDSVLSHSSFVRFPAIVVRRDAFLEVGLFDPEMGNPSDLDMWIRLFSRFGVHCVPETISGYSVHEQALTTGMFDEPTIMTIMTIFDRAAQGGILSKREVRRDQARWFHQFILAGAFRRLRAGDKVGAGRILALFRLPAVRALGRSGRWLPVQIGLVALTRLPRPLSLGVIATLDRASRRRAKA